MDDEVIIAAQIDGMTNDFLCATLRNVANEKQILERAYAEYLDLKHSNLWGSKKYF